MAGLDKLRTALAEEDRDPGQAFNVLHSRTRMMFSGDLTELVYSGTAPWGARENRHLVRMTNQLVLAMEALLPLAQKQATQEIDTSLLHMLRALRYAKLFVK